MLRVAVVGSGPAGLYTAEALVKQAAALPVPVAIAVDVLDRLPTPYGLVRYGVAPDHKSIKSVANYLRRVLESPDVRFLGGVHFGDHVTREDLLDAYDAVVYATGAMRDRRMAIPGEDLPGSFAATDFVNWYCGHPDVDPFAFTLDAESVAVIGVGNVAVDVARILVRDPAELEGTDVPEPVLAALRASKVREVHMIGRRGPAQAKFTTKELRELGELPGVTVSTEPAELDLAGFDASGESAALAETDRRVRGNLVALRAWESAPAGGGRTLRIRFWLRPLEILESSSGTVSSLRLERTRLTSDGVFEGTGETELLDAQMVLRSVGYQSVPLTGVPFDSRSHTVPNARRPRPRARRRAAARGVRGRLAEARPDRRDRDEQGRRGGDRPGAARRPGRRPRRGRRAAAAARAAAVPRRPDVPRRTARCPARTGTRRWPGCSRNAACSPSPTPNGCASSPRKPSSPSPSAAASA